MLMRAAVLTGFHTPMEIREVEIADPGPGEVRVQIKASGVCGSDLKAIDGKSPVVSELPFISGTRAPEWWRASARASPASGPATTSSSR